MSCYPFHVFDMVNDLMCRYLGCVLIKLTLRHSGQNEFFQRSAMAIPVHDSWFWSLDSWPHVPYDWDTLQALPLVFCEGTSSAGLQGPVL